MKAEQRRKELITKLMAAQKPLCGAALSRQLGVSRQIIVQDIAALRAEGYEIISTHQGYLVKQTPLFERVLKLKHSSEQTEDELNSIVSLGGMVMDVFVWHRVYGKITANLNIFSRADVENFVEGIRSGQSSELMHVTGGYHYHTIRADSEETLARIETVLAEKNYIAPEL